MALTVTVLNEAFPKDHEFAIHGLGLFKNGESREVTEEEEIAFMVFHRQAVRDAFEGTEDVEIKGTTGVKGGIASVLPPDDEVSTTPVVTPPVENEEGDK